MKIKTLRLQSMVTKVNKGASNNKLIPLTSMISLKASNGLLTLGTTDASNYLYVNEPIDKNDSLTAIVNSSLFSNLISKLTCEVVELKVTDKSLLIKGNGEYTLDIQVDETGEMIKFPEMMLENSKKKKSYEVNTSIIIDILNHNKNALASTLEVPVYASYYAADKIVSTDTVKICEVKEKLFEEPVLLNSAFMDLLQIITDDKITINILGNDIEAVSSNERVYGHLMAGVEEYQIDAINGLLEQEMPSKCTVNKNDLLGALDRLSMFVGPYDNGALKLEFDGFHSIKISSVQATGFEEVTTLTNEITSEEFSCLINVDTLLNQIKSTKGEKIEIQYGAENAIKIIDDNIIKVIALLEE